MRLNFDDTDPESLSALSSTTGGVPGLIVLLLVSIDPATTRPRIDRSIICCWFRVNRRDEEYSFISGSSGIVVSISVFFARRAAVVVLFLDPVETVDLASSVSVSPAAFRLLKLLRDVFEATEMLSSSSSSSFALPRVLRVDGVLEPPASDSTEVPRVRRVGVCAAKFSVDSVSRAKRIGVIRRLGVTRSSVPASKRCEFRRSFFGVPVVGASSASVVARRVRIREGCESSMEFLG